MTKTLAAVLMLMGSTIMSSCSLEPALASDCLSTHDWMTKLQQEKMNNVGVALGIEDNVGYSIYLNKEVGVGYIIRVDIDKDEGCVVGRINNFIHHPEVSPE